MIKYKLFKDGVQIGTYNSLVEAGAAYFADIGKTFNPIDMGSVPEQRYYVDDVIYACATAQAAIDLHCEYAAKHLLDNQDTKYMVTR